MKDKRSRLGRILDRAIEQVAPTWGLARARARALLSYAASSRTRLDRSWSVRKGADAHLRRVDQIRARSQELERENAIADGLLSRAVENVVGPSGIVPSPSTGDKGWNQAAGDLWRSWSPDARGLCDMAGWQSIVCRSYLRDGDVGAILLKSGEVQTIEADLIKTPRGKSDTARMVQGVEMNALRKPVAFHVLKDEGDTAATGETERVAARDFVYLPRVFRASQTRGLPVFSKPHLFEHLDEYIEAAVQSARIAACFGLVIKRDDTDPKLTAGTNDEGDTQYEFDVEPGMVEFLNPGESVEQIRPEQPTQTFDAFLAAVGRLLGLPLGIPLELVFLDFSRTNYSSARASLLQAYRAFECLQARLVWFLRRIYRWRVSKWIKAGILTPRDDAWNAEWIAPGWQWIDPLREAEANLLDVDSGMKTLAEAIRATGRDARVVFERRAEELGTLRELGIPVARSTRTRDEGEDGGDAGDDDTPEEGSKDERASR